MPILYSIEMPGPVSTGFAFCFFFFFFWQMLSGGQDNTSQIETSCMKASSGSQPSGETRLAATDWAGQRHSSVTHKTQVSSLNRDPIIPNLKSLDTIQPRRHSFNITISSHDSEDGYLAGSSASDDHNIGPLHIFSWAYERYLSKISVLAMPSFWAPKL